MVVVALNAWLTTKACCIIGASLESCLSTDLVRRDSDNFVAKKVTEGVDNLKIEENDDMIAGGLYVRWIDGSMYHWRLFDCLSDRLDKLTFGFQNLTMATKDHHEIRQ